MENLPNVTVFRRFISEKNKTLVVLGDIASVVEGRGAYEQRHGIVALDVEDRMVQRLLAAVGLAAVSLPERESWGWSVNLPGVDRGFFCGAEVEGMLCVRVMESLPETSVSVLQRQKAGGPLTQSHLEAQRPDPVDLVQRYFLEAVQTNTRIAVADSGQCALVQELPGGWLGALSQMDEVALVDDMQRRLREGDLEDAGEVLLFYECRCSEKFIDEMVGSMPPDQRAELFEGETGIEIECPRCGRDYKILNPG